MTKDDKPKNIAPAITINAAAAAAVVQMDRARSPLAKYSDAELLDWSRQQDREKKILALIKKVTDEQFDEVVALLNTMQPKKRSRKDAVLEKAENGGGPGVRLRK